MLLVLADSVPKSGKINVCQAVACSGFLTSCPYDVFLMAQSWKRWEFDLRSKGIPVIHGLEGYTIRNTLRGERSIIILTATLMSALTLQFWAEIMDRSV